ncbi:MAG: hypothetical protein NVSMB66_7620 [Candidatus Doudnabacteria bacterium]
METQQNPIGDRLSEVLENLKELKKIKGAEDLVKEMSIKSKSSITEMKKGRQDVSTELLDLLSKKFSVSKDYILRGIGEKFVNISPISTEQVQGNTLDISKLIESNLQQSIAQRELAEAHNVLAKTNAHLATVNAPQESREVVETMRSDFLELLAGIGSGELKWRSYQEAASFLSKRFHGRFATEKPKGIQSGSGKLSKGSVL